MTPPEVPAVVRVSGELDLFAAGALAERIDAAASGSSEVVVDLSDVTFLDASGIRSLLEARRRCALRGTALRLSGARGMPLRVLELCELQELLVGA